MQIEAMKRKIEAKMKAQGVQSHAALAQEIAVSIVEKNDESPVSSPSVQNPEAGPDEWTPTVDPQNTTSAPPSAQKITTTGPDVQRGSSSAIICTEDTRAVANSVLSEMGPDSRQTTSADQMTADNREEINQEEARLLAELEAERLAEEKARLKRCELEERLASARGRRVQHSPTITTSERKGSELQRNTISPLKDSTSSLHE